MTKHGKYSVASEGTWQCDCRENVFNSVGCTTCGTCGKKNPALDNAIPGRSNTETVPVGGVGVEVARNYGKTAKGPNKTELRYRYTYLRDADYRFEAITLRMANGHRYTADWCGFADFGRLHLIEIKGGYKLPSYQRSRLAFDQARIEFPSVMFSWAVWDGGKWNIENYNGGWQENDL
jgi:hypothetical protein